MAVAPHSLDTFFFSICPDESSALAKIINATKDRPSCRILFSSLLVAAMVEDPLNTHNAHFDFGSQNI
jgi:hypothetical protein